MHDEPDLKDPASVARVLREGARANLDASCRTGSIDTISPPGRWIATGDLHDNPFHFEKLVQAAGLTPGSDPADRAHLTLHEIIHPDTLIGGMDLSYRALTKVAALKAAHPELVHTLLANHELAQALGSGILKNGVQVVKAFDEGLDYVFGEEASGVAEAITEFVFSMPIAVRASTPQGDILAAHSLPGPAGMARFDTSILSREMTPDDYTPRLGSAHLMIWGRGYDADQLEDLTERWGVNLFILGHEHAEPGYALVEPNALVLSSDHARGVYLPIDLQHAPRLAECPGLVVPLA